MLSGMKSLVISDWLGKAQFQSCLSLSRKTIGFRQVADRRARRHCFDRLSLAGYTATDEGRYLFALFRSRLALRRDYYSTGQRRSVKVGGFEGIKPHYHEYSLSSFPIQSTRVLWPPLQPQHSVSFRVWSICSTCFEVWHLLCLHKR